MKTTLALVLLFLSGFIFMQAGEPSDLEQMQGKWVVVSLTELGKAIPAAETDLLLKRYYFTICVT